MKKLCLATLISVAVLSGCSSVPRGAIPVVDSTSSASELEQVAGSGGYRAPAAAPQTSASVAQDSGVVVMVPQVQTSTAPIQAMPITSNVTSSGLSYNTQSSSAPTGIVSQNVASSGLSADEQLDGPLLALLTTAQQQQTGGDLNGAASSLERAQRIAPREPQVLYRLAEVRLAQGDAAQAEQFARRGLSYANGRPALQASLWELIAQSRERQGDASGAAQARQNARVNL